MNRDETYDCVALLDHFGDHASILGLTVREVDLLNLMKRHLILGRLYDEDTGSKEQLRALREVVGRKSVS